MSVSSSVRRMTAAGAIAAAVVGAVGLPASAAQQSAAPHRAPVFISKVRADSGEGTTARIVR